LQPSEVYNSITATRLAVLCDSQAGSAPTSGGQVIANAKPAAPHIAVVLRILRVPVFICLQPPVNKGFFFGRGVLL
jgi:hypothetical protein